MSKAVGGQERAPGSWVWRAVRIAAIVVLVVSLGTGLASWFLNLPNDMLEVLDQRASVIGMFTGAAGLVVAMLGLRVQLRNRPVDDVASATGTPGPGQAEPAHARGPRRHTVLLIAAVPTVVVALIVLAVVRDAPVRYEAEDGSHYKAIPLYNIEGASNRASMGYLNYPESWVEIEVYAPRTDTYTVSVRYRAGDGDARQYLSVDGSVKRVLQYQGHTWKTWSHASVKLKLDHGLRKLRFQHDEGPFAAELDYVEIA
jgi:hypothetical protein